MLCQEERGSSSQRRCCLSDRATRTKTRSIGHMALGGFEVLLRIGNSALQTITGHTIKRMINFVLQTLWQLQSDKYHLFQLFWLLLLPNKFWKYIIIVSYISSSLLVGKTKNIKNGEQAETPSAKRKKLACHDSGAWVPFSVKPTLDMAKYLPPAEAACSVGVH